jgi:hypothetical protein
MNPSNQEKLLLEIQRFLKNTRMELLTSTDHLRKRTGQHILGLGKPTNLYSCGLALAKLASMHPNSEVEWFEDIKSKAKNLLEKITKVGCKVPVGDAVDLLIANEPVAKILNLVG